MTRRLVAVLLAFAMTLVLPTVRSAAAMPPSTTVAYSYDVASNSSGSMFVAGIVSTAVRAHASAPAAPLTGDFSALYPVFVAADTGSSVLNFGSKAAAREGLPGDLSTAGNRFFRGATSKSQDFQAHELPGGGYRLQFFSPANNPGYGKLYVQEIDGSGNVLREYKNTMGPDGLIETKWVHGGP